MARPPAEVERGCFSANPIRWRPMALTALGLKTRLAGWSPSAIAIAWAFFILNGALIMWSPLWAVACCPLWGMPICFIGAAWLFGDFRRGQQGARKRAVWVGASVLVFALHLLLGGNQIWLRCGLELRLWQVGGITQVESWVDSYVGPLQAEWDRRLASDGFEQLSQASRERFFVVTLEDIPPCLKPLAYYLRPTRIIHVDGRPAGVSFRFGIHEASWGLNVYKDGPPKEEAGSWPRRLGHRSYVWGRSFGT
jgi:hypothetical protein